MNIEGNPDRALQEAAQRVHGVSSTGNCQSLPGCDPMELALYEPTLAWGWTRWSPEAPSNPTIQWFWGITPFASMKNTVRRNINVEMLTFPAGHSLEGKTVPEAASFRATTSNFHFLSNHIQSLSKTVVNITSNYLCVCGFALSSSLWIWSI